MLIDEVSAFYVLVISVRGKRKAFSFKKERRETIETNMGKIRGRGVKRMANKERRKQRGGRRRQTCRTERQGGKSVAGGAHKKNGSYHLKREKI